LPLAVGGGIYSAYTGGKEVSLCVFGEGATDIGAFNESLNLASVWNLPVVFFCVNNQYAMGMPVAEASAQEEIWRNCLEEVQQLAKVQPRIAKHIGPPCHMRREAGVKPLCPEGVRYCGVPVWRVPLDEMKRTL